MVALGEVSADRRIIVPVVVRGDNDLELTVYTTMDTSFRGALALPIELIDDLQLTQTSSQSIPLQDGNYRTVNTFAVMVQWRDQEFQTSVVTASEHPLIGMRLLYGCDIHAHILDGGFVTVADL